MVVEHDERLLQVALVLSDRFVNELGESGIGTGTLLSAPRAEEGVDCSYEFWIDFSHDSPPEFVEDLGMGGIPSVFGVERAEHRWEFAIGAVLIVHHVLNPLLHSLFAELLTIVQGVGGDCVSKLVVGHNFCPSQPPWVEYTYPHGTFTANVR